MARMENLVMMAAARGIPRKTPTLVATVVYDTATWLPPPLMALVAYGSWVAVKSGHLVPVAGGGKVEEWLGGENGDSLGQAAVRQGTALCVVGNGDDGLGGFIVN